MDNSWICFESTESICPHAGEFSWPFIAASPEAIGTQLVPMLHMIYLRPFPSRCAEITSSAKFASSKDALPEYLVSSGSLPRVHSKGLFLCSFCAAAKARIIVLLKFFLTIECPLKYWWDRILNVSVIFPSLYPAKWWYWSSTSIEETRRHARHLRWSSICISWAPLMSLRDSFSLKLSHMGVNLLDSQRQNDRPLLCNRGYVTFFYKSAHKVKFIPFSHILDAGRQHTHCTWYKLLCSHLIDEDGPSWIMVRMRSTVTTFTRSVIYLIIMFSDSQQLSAVSAYGHRLWMIWEHTRAIQAKQQCTSLAQNNRKQLHCPFDLRLLLCS